MEHRLTGLGSMVFGIMVLGFRALTSGFKVPQGFGFSALAWWSGVQSGENLKVDTWALFWENCLLWLDPVAAG